MANPGSPGKIDIKMKCTRECEWEPSIKVFEENLRGLHQCDLDTEILLSFSWPPGNSIKARNEQETVYNIQQLCLHVLVIDIYI